MKSLVSDEGFGKFKQFSAKYRAGEFSGEEYYRQFFSLFGVSEQTKELFSLLASLLPDAEKRMELLQLHTINCAPRPEFRREQPRTEQQQVNPKPKNKNKKNKGKNTPGAASTNDAAVATPAQTKADSEFPALAQQQQPSRQAKNKKQKGKQKRQGVIEEEPEGIEGTGVYMKLH